MKHKLFLLEILPDLFMLTSLRDIVLSKSEVLLDSGAHFMVTVLWWFSSSLLVKLDGFSLISSLQSLLFNENCENVLECFKSSFPRESMLLLSPVAAQEVHWPRLGVAKGSGGTNRKTSCVLICL